MAIPIKLNIATKTDYASRPSVPSNQKQSADEFNLVTAAIAANYDRLVLRWDTDITANTNLTVGQYVHFTDNKIYRIITGYNVGSPITWVGGNAVVTDAGGAGTVTSVTGTTNRITSTGGATPVINIDAAYDAAITAQIAAAQVGLWDDRGTFDASVAAYPSSGGSGTAGAILKGDIWAISVAGTLPTGQVVEIGDTVRALIDTPGNTQANWAILQNNIGFVPENVANKAVSITASATLYPNNNAVLAALDLKSDSTTTVKQKVDSYALDSTDLTDLNAGKELIFEMNKATPLVLTIPDNATLAIPVGKIWYARRIGAGQLSMVGGGSMVLTFSSGMIVDEGANVLMMFEKTGTNTVMIQNGLPASPSYTVMACFVTASSAISTNAPNSPQVIAGISNSIVKFDSTFYNFVRVALRVNTASVSANTPRAYPRYNADATPGTFITVGAGTVASGEAVAVNAIAYKVSNWIALPAGAKADVWWQVAEDGGDGVADPAYSSVYLHFKV